VTSTDAAPGLEMLVGPTPGPLDTEAAVAAYPWPEERRWVRANMVMTLDGAAAGPDGLSGSITSAGDQVVFRAIRRMAEVVLVGAETIRKERYSAMRRSEDEQRRRATLGLSPAPVVTIVSLSLDLPWDEPLFASSTVTPIVLTAEAADPDRVAQARRHADVVVLPGDRVRPADALDALEDRGLRRVVCEGGPRLLAELVEAGLLDEADITISPRFVGSQGTPRTPMLDLPVDFALAHVIRDGDFLVNRYVRSV
jgi:riboflavin biosynthesis pyrimidine reductase